MAQTWAFRRADNNVGLSAGATTTAKAFGAAVSAGDLLICVWTGGGDKTPTFADSVNGAWNGSVVKIFDAGNNQTMVVSWHANSGAGTPTVTVTHASATDRGMIISAYSGIKTSSPGDQTKTNNTGSTTSPGSGNTSNLAEADELVFGACMEDSAGTATITSSDVTIGANQGPAIVNNIDMACGHKNGPAAGSPTSTGFTFSGSRNGLVIAATFKQAATTSVGGGLVGSARVGRPGLVAA